MKNKKAVSLMVSYALLVVIATAISALVYSHLKLIAPVDRTECNLDIALSIEDAICDPSTNNLTLTVANRGLFNVSVMYVRMAKEGRAVKNQINKGNTVLPFPIPPTSGNFIYTYDISPVINNTVLNYEVEIQAGIIRGREEIPCPNAIAIKKVICDATTMCSSNADCTGGGECTPATCTNGNCVYSSANNGAPCNSGAGVCNAGICGIVASSPCAQGHTFNSSTGLCTAILTDENIKSDGFVFSNGINYTSVKIDIGTPGGIGNGGIERRGFVDWNISSIPTNALVTALSFEYNSDEPDSSRGEGIVGIRNQSLEPHPTSLGYTHYADLFVYIGTSPAYYNTSKKFITKNLDGSPVRIDFNNKSVEDFNADLADTNPAFDWFAVGMIRINQAGIASIRSKETQVIGTAPKLIVTYKLPTTEICNNGLDDDGDSLIDCFDSDCSTDSWCNVLLSTCQTLNHSNAVYTIKNNIINESTCFKITKNNITLRGNSYSMAGTTLNNGIAVVAQNNIVGLLITNMNITNFKEGISFDGVNESIIENSIISHTRVPSGGDGILIKNGWRNIIRNNNIFSNDGAGISLDSSVENTLFNNHLWNNDWNGINIVFGNNNLILKNNASQNLADGMLIQLSTKSNNLTENIICGNLVFDIKCSSDNNNFGLNNMWGSEQGCTTGTNNVGNSSSC